MRPIITLTTDFGIGDYDTGVLSGVIWRIAPEARVVDLSHAIPRHDVFSAALLLERCTPYFPEGTIHIVVVDPGVGTGRRGLAARLGSQRFVGPDNGLLTRMRHRALKAMQPVEIVHLNQPDYWLPEVSAIFHGRDVFASVAAHLAAGVGLDELGERIDDPVLLNFPEAVRAASGWQGTVTHVDAFGNLSTNLGVEQIPRDRQMDVRIGGAVIRGLKTTFSDGAPGELAALIDSSGKLCVCVVNGSAANRLGIQVGDSIRGAAWITRAVKAWQTRRSSGPAIAPICR